MKALSKKLLRDVWKHRGQMLSIAAVVSVGIMTVMTMRGAYESLLISQELYYGQARFPDAWARLERAPESLRRRIENLPGVATVDTRVSFIATLDVPGVDAPALGQFISIPERKQPELSKIHLKTGRYVAAGRRNEVIISDNFALANNFIPGDTLRAVINGRLRDLDIVGTAISPEYTYAVPPGALYPEDERYGIIWMSRQALGPAYNMEGAFNEVLLTFAPRVDPNVVIAELDRVLEPYGGLGAYLRKDQISHQILESELQGNRTTGTVIPIVFLAVAAFLLNIVLSRMIATERTEIAVLKAFGYSNREVGGHYLRFAMVAVLLGAIIGIYIGILLGRSMVQLYGDFFDFPTLHYAVSWKLVTIAMSISTLAAAAGALGAVWQAIKLPPAEAMRPEAPARFKPGLVERIGVGRLLPTAGRMILRNIERKPMRSAFSSLGVAFSVAILVIGFFMFDGVQYMMDLQFRVAQREDLSLTFNRPLSQSVRYDLSHLEGVTRVEPYRVVPVRLRAGHYEREAGITGLAPGAQLRRIVTASGGTQPLPPEGLVMSAILAKKLGIKTGERVTVEVLEGARHSSQVTVTGIVEDFLGITVYMNLEALHKLTRGGRAINGALLSVEPEARTALNAHLKRLPSIAGVASPATMLASFEKQMAEGLFISVFFMIGFSSVIAVAVVYNGARISLSERGRELASLRVLGFSRREVAVLLLGEQALVTLVALPIGCVLGYVLAAAVSAGLQSDLYRIPMIVSFRTYFWASSITVIAAILSGLIVRRRLNRLNLIEVLKTRE